MTKPFSITCHALKTFKLILHFLTLYFITKIYSKLSHQYSIVFCSKLKKENCSLSGRIVYGNCDIPSRKMISYNKTYQFTKADCISKHSKGSEDNFHKSV